MSLHEGETDYPAIASWKIFEIPCILHISLCILPAQWSVSFKAFESAFSYASEITFESWHLMFENTQHTSSFSS